MILSYSLSLSLFLSSPPLPITHSYPPPAFTNYTYFSSPALAFEALLISITRCLNSLASSFFLSCKRLLLGPY
ncbi:hypothetical protein BD560DRAFT_410788 [Blakeslea trispora]|nr:hypothetical protein BD560DRAFT_410788 [Blakeslea trispora]